MAYSKANLQPIASLFEAFSQSNYYSPQTFLITEYQKELTLSQQPNSTQSDKIQTIQKKTNDTLIKTPNPNLSPVAQIGIFALALSALVGFFFLKKGFSLSRIGRKKSVPENDVINHSQEFKEITTLAKQVQQANSEKFTGREFILYLKIKADLVSSRENGFYKSIRFVKESISGKRYYDQVFVVEARFLGRRQQELYRFADDLINQNIFGEEFRQKIEAKLNDTLPAILNDEGKNALKVYATSLTELSYHEYGLELLARFKRYDMSSYSVIRIVSDLVTKFEQFDLTNSQIILHDIMLEIDTINKLAAIVSVPETFVNPKGFVKIFHFLALDSKQEDTARQFKQLLIALEKWRIVYQQLKDIRSCYDPENYRLPKEFNLKIPGEDVFAQYRSLIPKVLEYQQDFIEAEYRERDDFGAAAFF